MKKWIKVSLILLVFFALIVSVCVLTTDNNNETIHDSNDSFDDCIGFNIGNNCIEKSPKLQKNITIDDCIGFNIGDDCIERLQTGQQNIAIGWHAGINWTTESNMVAINCAGLDMDYVEMAEPFFKLAKIICKLSGEDYVEYNMSEFTNEVIPAQ